MTDAEIEAAANKRLAAESEPAADVAPAAGAPTAAAAPDPYAALDEAEARMRAEEKGKKSNFIENSYKKLPEEAKPYAAGVAGATLGAIVRKALPEKKVYGTPAYREAQAKIEADRAAAPLAQRAADRAYDTLGGAHREHAVTGQQLQQQLLTQQQEHAANARALDQAMRQHAYANTLSVDDELARRAASAALPSSSDRITGYPPAELTAQPRGGAGTAAYGEKFGLDPVEARRAASMSDVQQKNIPAQQAAWNKISSIAPSFEAVKESPLLLGTEGQKAVQERVAAQQAAAIAQAAQVEQQKAYEEQQRRQLQADFARQKAEAQMRLEAARDAFKASERAAREAAQAHAAHSGSPAMSRSSQDAQHRTIDEYEELQRRLKNADPNAVMRALTKVGTTLAPRLVPMAGGAFAPIQAANAKKSYDQGRYGPMLAQGLGSAGNVLQATGIPPLMGAGSLMQIPAGAVELYDALASGSETGR